MKILKHITLAFCLLILTAAFAGASVRNNFDNNIKVSRFLLNKNYDAGIVYDLKKNIYALSFRYRGTGYKWYVNKNISAFVNRIPLPTSEGVYSLRVSERGSYIESLKASLETVDGKTDIEALVEKYHSVLGKPDEEYKRDRGDTYRSYYYIIHGRKYINVVFTVAYKEEIKKTIVTMELVYKGRADRSRLNYY